MTRRAGAASRVLGSHEGGVGHRERDLALAVAQPVQLTAFPSRSVTRSN
ncbi:hypothetical protein [Blastococcus sp. KM273129]|nr:hypothetical protein [Blastococcus sp. KM273129]